MVWVKMFKRFFLAQAQVVLEERHEGRQARKFGKLYTKIL